MSKDQIIRDTAYAIWEAEGRPDGQADDHWTRASAQVEAQVAESNAMSSMQTDQMASSGAKADAHVAEAAAPKKPRAKKKVAAMNDAEVIVGGD
jgi:hypothetical protein